MDKPYDTRRRARLGLPSPNDEDGETFTGVNTNSEEFWANMFGAAAQHSPPSKKGQGGTGIYKGLDGIEAYRTIRDTIRARHQEEQFIPEDRPWSPESISSKDRRHRDSEEDFVLSEDIRREPRKPPKQPRRVPEKEPSEADTNDQEVPDMGDGYIPVPDDLEPHPEGEHDHRWWENAYCNLSQQIESFSKEYFGADDLEDGLFYGSCSKEMTPEILSYSKAVAQADPENGGWDTILRSAVQRQRLVQAIVARILFAKVFTMDLFGADEFEEELVHNVDKAFLHSEGFERTSLRSSITRNILGARTVTRGFYYSVGILTKQIELLFAPFLDTLFPLTSHGKKAYQQALYNIVVKAAYISICIRVSKTILHVYWPRPGEKYEIRYDQVILENELAKASKS